MPIISGNDTFQWVQITYITPDLQLLISADFSSWNNSLWLYQLLSRPMSIKLVGTSNHAHVDHCNSPQWFPASSPAPGNAILHMPLECFLTCKAWSYQLFVEG